MTELRKKLKKAKLISVKGEATVLARGERTGHWHGFEANDNVVLLEIEETGERFIEMKNGGVFRHEEHDHKTFVGDNIAEVIQQSEYVMESVRNVFD